jgi:transposase
MGNEKKRFVGIDLSKRTYEAVAITVDPQTITRWNGKLDPRGRKCLLEKLNAGDIVALEAGTASFKIAKEIQGKPGIMVIVLNAANLAIIHASLKKTDKEDALKLARLVQKYSPEELPVVPIPTDQEMERRALVAHETRFRQDRVRLINRLHAVFLRAGFPDHTKRQLGIATSREKLIVSELDGFNLAEAMNLHHMIIEYEKILEALNKQINDTVVACGEDAEILLSIPGFGIKTTMAVLAYAGDMRRFENPSQLVNYIGFSPRLYASGDIERSGSITKRGNPQVRWLLIQSAWCMVQSKAANPLKDRFDAMLKRGKAKSVAIVALARKLLELVFILLTRREKYRFIDPSLYTIKLRRAGFNFFGAESC